MLPLATTATPIHLKFQELVGKQQELREKDIEKKLKEAESWYDSVKQYF